MRQDISEPCNSLPLDLWNAGPEIGWQTPGGFANDLEISNYGIDRFVIPTELIETKSARISLNLVASSDDVVQEYSWVTRHEQPRAKCCRAGAV